MAPHLSEMQDPRHSPRVKADATIGDRARSPWRAYLAVLVCLALVLPFLANGPVASVLGTVPATAEGAEPEMPPVCGEGQTRDCIKGSDEVRLRVMPTTIALPDAYPSCVGAANSEMSPTGTCEQLALTVEVDFPACAEVGTGVDCYDSIAWGGNQLDIWYSSWTFAGVFRFLKSEVGQCTGADLACDRFFLIGSATKDLGGHGWLILSDPEVSVRDYSAGSADPNEYERVTYRPEAAVYVPPAEFKSPNADFEYTVDADRSGIARFTSTSTEPDGRLLSIGWDFGDGSTGIGVRASHPYLETGFYTVTVTARTIFSGATDSASKTIFVEVADPDTDDPYPPGDVPIVSVEATDNEASESGDTGTWTLTRSKKAGELTVDVSLSGSATEGADYEALADEVTFSDSVDEVQVTLVPVADELVEGPETATLTIDQGTGYTRGDPYEADITILDTTAPPTTTPGTTVPATTSPGTTSPPATAPATPTLPAGPTPVGCIDTASVAAGAPLTVCGDGFLPGEQVQVLLHSVPKQLAAVTADVAGNVRTTVTVPAGTVAGSHRVELRGVKSGLSLFSVPFTVTAAAAAIAPTATTAPAAATKATAATTLPLTGASPARWAFLGTILVIAGIGILRSRRWLAS